jgi:di/tricarboxylate transporter
VAQQALGSGQIPFVRWFAAALPIVLVGTFAAWAVVILLWRPFDHVDFIPIPLAKTVDGGGHGAPVAEGMHGAPPTAAYGTMTDGHVEHVHAAGAGDMGENVRTASAAHATPTNSGAGGHASTNTRAHSGPTGDAPLLEHTAVPTSAGGCEASARGDGDDESQRKEARREVAIIIAVLVVTVVLWCVPEDAILGDTGVVALIPIVVFFGVGILKKADFNSLSWHLIFLLSGGNMLGLMSRESHLLEIVINQLRPFLESHGTFAVVAVLISSVALVTTFVSHTVASLLLMPVIVEVSQVNPSLPSSAALVFLSVIMCSGSMAFPITSFPNVNSLLTESAAGDPYLVARHFLLPGLCMSALVLAQLTTYMVYYSDALFPRGA